MAKKSAEKEAPAVEPAPETKDEGAQPAELTVDLLKEDPRNARKISRSALAGLKFSLHKFGDLSGLVWNETMGELVSGHQRMKALRLAGATTWKRIAEDEGAIIHPKTNERFRIRIVRWDEETHRQAQIVANNPHIQGEYTEEAIEQLRAMEDSIMFDALKLDELQEELDKEIAAAEDALEEGGGGGEDVDLPEKFLVIVTCKDDNQQAQLLERLRDEGFAVKAVMQ